MKKFIYFSLFFLSLLLSDNICGQNSIKEQTIVPKHSHPEIDLKMEELEKKAENADFTFQKAQETYSVIKEYDRKMESREKTNMTFIQIIIACVAGFVSLMAAFGFISYFVNNHLSKKARVNREKELFDEMKDEMDKTITTQTIEISKITNENKEDIKYILAQIQKEKGLRENSKILVINHKESKISISDGFMKVLNLFGGFNYGTDLLNVDKLSDVINNDIIQKLMMADLVILENQVRTKIWEIGVLTPQVKDLNELIIDENTPDKLTDHLQNQKIMILLANKICTKTAFIYYGASKDRFPVESVDENIQHMIAFANSPSALYSNIMNMLTFRNILNQTN